MDVAVSQKESWQIIFYQDAEKYTVTGTRICPLMRRVRSQKVGADKCDCSRLRVIAIKILDQSTRCKAGRPCPVREYLLK